MTNFSNDFPFGYCTNVHAGITLLAAQANLERIAVEVRRCVAPKGALPVGLWLPEQAARQLVATEDVARFRDWLRDRQLMAYTFNGFPQGDFHQPVVKHAVYSPTWLESTRVDYTCLLADILAGLLPEGATGSISTLPLGWPHSVWNTEDFRIAGDNLRRVAAHLRKLADDSGREIVLAIEPEPGCVLDTAPDIIRFFEQFVFEAPSGAAKASEAVVDCLRRHITVCHDICHSAVMFEPQEFALKSYINHGIRVGKVQVSSAIEVPWPEIADESSRATALAQLRSFSEPRYLHQTTRLTSQAGQVEMLDDLPKALDQWLPTLGRSDGSWRIHFHVPIYVDRFGSLRATRDEITRVVRCLADNRAIRIADRPWFSDHFEVETYAWGVLPTELGTTDLAQGIARELNYFQSILDS